MMATMTWCPYHESLARIDDQLYFMELLFDCELGTLAILHSCSLAMHLKSA